jgi:hypothetical protein
MLFIEGRLCRGVVVGLLMFSSSAPRTARHDLAHAAARSAYLFLKIQFTRAARTRDLAIGRKRIKDMSHGHSATRCTESRVLRAQVAKRQEMGTPMPRLGSSRVDTLHL